jgi:cytochrome c556
VTIQLRQLSVAAALVVGLWCLAPAGGAPPAFKSDSYKKAAEADIAFLQKRLGELAAAEEPRDGQRKPAITVAMTLAAAAEALGDTALKADALKIADAVMKKDVKAAAELAKKLTIKPGSPGKGELPKLDKFDVELAMTAFRNTKTGGLNLERDLKDYISMKDPKPVVPADVELLAVRSALMMEYAADLHYDGKYPSGLSVTAASKAEWTKWMRESVELSRQIADEASKGAAANTKLLVKQLKALDTKCYECHNKYRFEP